MHALQKQYEPQIHELVDVCHACAARQYTTSQGGNLSWRVGPDDVLITPTQVNKGKVAFDDIVVVGMDNGVKFAAPGRRPTGEVYIHVGIYRKRPDIASAIHAHPAWLTALALSNPFLLQAPYLPEPIIEVGPVAVTEYAQPLTEELARTFDPVIERHNAFIMRNHGMVMLSVAGVQRCFEMLEMLEVTAKSVAVAQMLGGAVRLDARHVRNLGETVRARNLRLPGKPGAVRNLEDLF